MVHIRSNITRILGCCKFSFVHYVICVVGNERTLKFGITYWEVSLVFINVGQSIVYWYIFPYIFVLPNTMLIS